MQFLLANIQTIYLKDRVSYQSYYNIRVVYYPFLYVLISPRLTQPSHFCHQNLQFNSNQISMDLFKVPSLNIFVSGTNMARPITHVEQAKAMEEPEVVVELEDMIDFIPNQEPMLVIDRSDSILSMPADTRFKKNSSHMIQENKSEPDEHVNLHFSPFSHRPPNQPVGQALSVRHTLYDQLFGGQEDSQPAIKSGFITTEDMEQLLIRFFADNPQVQLDFTGVGRRLSSRQLQQFQRRLQRQQDKNQDCQAKCNQLKAEIGALEIQISRRIQAPNQQFGVHQFKQQSETLSQKRVNEIMSQLGKYKSIMVMEKLVSVQASLEIMKGLQEQNSLMAIRLEQPRQQNPSDVVESWQESEAKTRHLSVISELKRKIKIQKETYDTLVTRQTSKNSVKQFQRASDLTARSKPQEIHVIYPANSKSTRAILFSTIAIGTLGIIYMLISNA